MKKVERKLKNDLKVESHLKVEDVKEDLKFNNKERVGVSINWKRVFTAVPVMAALALAVALQFGNFGGSGVQPTRTLTSVVTLDINPGILINLDENDVVISVEALNADAETLLLDVDTTITDLDELVAAIIAAAEANDFLMEEDTILFSVQSEDEEHNDELEDELQNTVSEEAQKLGKDIEAVVNKYKEILDTETSVISQAKAKLIEALIVAGDYTIDDIDELSQMRVNEMKVLLEEAYGISIQMVMAEEEDQTSEGQEVVRAKLVEEILELELLTLEEIAVMETKDLRDVLKDYNKIQGNAVKEMAEEEVEETERQKYIETLSGLGILTPEELEAMDLDDLEDALEDYYDSIEDEEEAKEKAKEKAQEAKEKAEKAAEKRNNATNDAEDKVEEAYNKLEELQAEYDEKMAELEQELVEANSGIVELEAQLADLQSQLTASGLTETEIAELEAEVANVEADIAELYADIAEINAEMVELTEELALDIAELEADIAEEVAEALEEAHEDEEKAQNEADKILSKGLKDYYEELMDAVDSEEEANELLALIEADYQEMLAELNAKLVGSGLTEEGIEDLQDIIDDTQEDYDEFVEEINEFLTELYEEETEAAEEAEEDFMELQEELAELVDEYVVKLAELEAKGHNGSGVNPEVLELTTEYLEELEELIIEIEAYEEITSGLKELYRTATFETLMEYLNEQLENPELTEDQVLALEERISELQEEYDGDVESEEDEEDEEEDTEEEDEEDDSETESDDE